MAKQLDKAQPATVAPQPTESPLADSATTIELMTPEQQQLFLLKEHARILIVNGQLTVEDAVTHNLISRADGDELLQLIEIGNINTPRPVIEAPAESPTSITKRCCN